jgi:hypothetical protein
MNTVPTLKPIFPGRLILALLLIAAATDARPDSGHASATLSDSVAIGSFTFDGTGGPDPMGWTTVDFTDRGGPFFHIDDFAGLGGGSFGGLTALQGARSLWCGARPTICSYATLPGYGANWSEAFVSVPFAVTGDVDVSFLARFDSEPGYDFTHLEYFTKHNRWHTLASFDGAGGPAFVDLSVSETIPADSLAGTVRVRLRFSSDPSYDDEDGDFDSDGAVIVDALVIADALGVVDAQDFESEGAGSLATSDGDWGAVETPRFGDYAGLFEGTSVLQEDAVNPSAVWGFFKDSPDTYACGGHPEQATIPYERNDGLNLDNGLVSPAIDLSPFLSGGSLPSAATIVVEYDIYLDKYLLFPDEEAVRHLVYVRSRVDGCWQREGNFVAWVGGGSGEWHRKSFDVAPMIAVGATHVQVVFREFNYLGESCRSHAPLIDNVAIYATGVSTAVVDHPRGAVVLHPNYPNPFNPRTRVTYEVPAPGSIVSLRIYDAAGRWVQTIEEGFVGGGLRTATWDGTNRNGERVASGVYFCRLGTPAGTHTRKMVLLK